MRLTLLTFLSTDTVFLGIHAILLTCHQQRAVHGYKNPCHTHFHTPSGRWHFGEFEDEHLTARSQEKYLHLENDATTLNWLLKEKGRTCNYAVNKDPGGKSCQNLPRNLTIFLSRT